MFYDIKEGLKMKKIDVHTHLWLPSEKSDDGERFIECAERVGIVEMWCSRPIGGRMGSMDEIRNCNDGVLRAMERYPNRVKGLCFIIGGYNQKALKEVERCLDAGMIGIKLYNQYKIQDPAMWPIIELASERHVPILIHAAYLSPPFLEEQLNTSHGEDIAKISQRYPDALIINGHIGGGGDWEYTIRALADASPNVYVDTGGSNLDDGQIEFAIDHLGVERLLFATDNVFEGGVGKILGASIPAEVKERIFWKNASELLAKQNDSN